MLGAELEVQLDAEDLGIDAEEERGVVDVGAAVGAHFVGVARAFHLDHLGAEERQQLACVRPGPHLGEFDDAHAFQRATPGHLGGLSCGI